MAYTYPKNKLEVIDGSLRPVASVPNDLVLVIERAYTGPSNTVYLVDDLTLAKNTFGDKSPLLALANRAKAGRAKNIALFRVGGGAHSYENIFGESTALRLTEESIKAADNLKVYIGPEPKNNSRSAVVVFEGDRVIYSNVLGGEIRSSKVALDGFDKHTLTALVGSIKNPVPFREILDNIKLPAETQATTKKENVDSKEWVILDPTEFSGYEPGIDLNAVYLKRQDTDEDINFTVSTDGTKILINEWVDGSSEAVPTGTALKVTFMKTAQPDELKTFGIKYVPAKDSMNATYKELYEVLDQALEQLELLPTKAVLVGDWFNAPNIAEGSKDANRLEYLKKGEDQDGYVTYKWSDKKYVYQWTDPSDKKVKTTDDIALADVDLNGQPIIVDRFNEVDFTHRLGMFALGKLDDGDFLNVVIGAKGPINGSPRALNDWVGSSPKRDERGNIVENGSGLLGHRMMVGTTDYSGGYFATDNGFVDGEILTDITGFPVDLGKHISIVVSQVVVAAATSPNAVTSAAATYAGLVSNLQPGDSTTNQAVNNMILVSDIKESKRKALSRAGYVVFLEKPKGLTVYSGDLATRETSDFNYISTALAVSSISRLITDTVDPYIGKGIDLVALTALKTNLTTALGNAQRAGWMISFDFRIKRDGPNTLLIPFIIEAKDELRSVSNIVRLTRSDLSIEV